MRNPEIWIILIIVGFLLFGAKKMPDAARGLGRSLRIFKAETKGLVSDDEQTYHQPPQPPAQIPAAPPQEQVSYEKPAPAAASATPAGDAQAPRPEAQ